MAGKEIDRGSKPTLGGLRSLRPKSPHPAHQADLYVQTITDPTCLNDFPYKAFCFEQYNSRSTDG